MDGGEGIWKSNAGGACWRMGNICAIIERKTFARIIRLRMGKFVGIFSVQIFI